MALSRRSGARFHSAIWPGFVDAMTGLLLILMFVLTIFMIMQSVLRDTITGQEQKLNDLSKQITALASELGLEKAQNTDLTSELTALRSTLVQAEQLAADQKTQIAQLLTVQNQQAQTISTLKTQAADLSANITAARAEADAQKEAARLAAARREALEALIADLRSRNATATEHAATLSESLSAAEKARLAEAAAAELLRKKLEGAQGELDTMTLVLDQERKKAEDLLTKLAAARAANGEASGELSEAEKQRALLKVAQDELAQAKSQSIEAQRQQEVLSRQVIALRAQLAELRQIIGEAQAKDDAAQVKVENLGRDLNAALARAAAEERKRRTLEEEKSKLLEQQNQKLEKYRSDFFGRLRDVVAEQDNIEIVGDRFVFGAEVLFPPGSAELSAAGKREVAKVAQTLIQVAEQIPGDIPWIMRVDGHTDDTPLAAASKFADNWELSQARALSVVRFMINDFGVPPERLSANGFGQYQPLVAETNAAARARNRRIELKLTER